VTQHARQQHVLERSEGRQQVVELEHETDRAAAQCGAGVVVDGASRLAE
jgi:hypothetical protein